MIILLFVTMSSLQLKYILRIPIVLFLTLFGKRDFFVDYKFNAFLRFIFIPLVDADKIASLKHNINSKFAKFKQFV